MTTEVALVYLIIFSFANFIVNLLSFRLFKNELNPSKKKVGK